VAVETTIEAVGIKDALKVLNDLDKSARRAITRDYKQIVQSVVNDAQGNVPINPPMSGWNRQWKSKSGFMLLPYHQAATDTVKAGVSGRKPKNFGGFMQNLATFFVRFTGPTAVIMDMAGRGNVETTRGEAMVRTLNSRLNGGPSRILWKAYETHESDVKREMDNLVERVMREASEAIARNRKIG
jgi:hypothetical protein